MINPASEVRSFVRAALVTPVPRDHTESDAAFRRRRVVAVVTLLVGTAVLTLALRIAPGDPAFYAATVGLALVWTVGAFASGPLHLGRARTRSGGDARPIVQSLALGALLLAVFLLGGLVIARIPLLRDPVTNLLDHARLGSLPVVALITAVNGVSEELYFRGALYSAIGRRHAVLVTTVVYALTTVGSGIPLLVLAAALLGLLTGLQRRVTGGILGPVITHLTWSLGMLFLLPTVLSSGS
ncbi:MULTISPECIES: CPBP family intramembrane glutamic endopeptidase [unclassified Phycicoccus]|uniref:CPBP family intramembrane glutamic endopeptidase n=1 Tax=unclassified Phycicoccus TaxID=2637926 RepID=UPI000702D370|nr:MULTISPECIES: CPBP family intramembrane glutamic endopeptidase [unclassified Phycicoccus]KQU64628.1 abortive infection protein [Phycicoccus sp. Root101]KQZ89266.1 abortive infection protein [Phycicoccus sp. Root563]